MSLLSWRPQALAFDLDGTLIDSAPDIAQALNRTLLGAGLQEFDLDTVRGWIGDGPDRLIGRALAAQGLQDADDALRRRLRAGFDNATLEAPLERGQVYAGIAPMLERLRLEWPLVVVTNKPTALARAVLAAARLLPHLAAVYGADEPSQRKPAPVMLQTAAQRLGIPVAALLMVGDSQADVRAALAAGCRVAVVDWGYGRETVQQLEREVWRVQTPQHLLASLLRRGEEPSSTFGRLSSCLQEADRL